MTTPLISVIMPCFNMGHYIGEALQSVGAQTYNSWEVIAVDDCGTDDGTRQAVFDFKQMFPYHRVEYIRHETNRGVGAARNTAIKASKGELLAFLDPDDIWLPTKLEKQMDRLKANPATVACFTLGLFEKQGDVCLWNPDTNVMGYVPSQEQSFDTIMVANRTVLFPFSSFLLRRKAFDQVGGFQEALPFQNEDRLLTGCVASFGSIIGFAEPLCIYRIHETSATNSVIKFDAANMVDFDLTARIALWLRFQTQSYLTGLEVVKGPVRSNLRAVLRSRSWMKWYRIVMGLCTRLTFAYPSQAWFLFLEFLRELLIRTFRLRQIRRAIKNLNTSFNQSRNISKRPNGSGMA